MKPALPHSTSGVGVWWEGRERTGALAARHHSVLAAAKGRLVIAVLEHRPLWADVRCHPLTQSSGADDRHSCLTARSIRAIVAFKARPASLTTGEGVTSVTWTAACGLFICSLNYPPPGASGEAAPRSGRAVVIHLWDVDKAEYGCRGRSPRRLLSRARTFHWRIARQQT